MRIFYLEKCRISDKGMAKIVKTLQKASSLKEIYLVNMALGPIAIAELTQLATMSSLNGSEIGISLRQSHLLANEFKSTYPFILNWDYPLIH